MADFQTVFSALPAPLMDKLEESYNEVKQSFLEGKYEPSELNAAKFCEVVFRVLEWHASGTLTPLSTHVSNFENAVKKFEPNVSLNDSVRFHIPRILTALYTIRNKRGVGHVGGDVNPNFMDSVFVVSGCDWVMAELVRILHDLSPIEAQKLVASIVTKKIPIVWEVGDVKRVLNPQMSARSQTLILLYHSDPDPVIDSTLCRWVGYSNCSVYASKILKPLHHERLLEYGDDHRTRLSPLGKKFVEDDLALQLT